MLEMWLDNPRKIGRRSERRPRVTVSGDTVTFGPRSPFKGRVRRANAPGGTLMLANKRHRRRRGTMPAGLKRYWASHRGKTNPRRRRHSVSVRRYRRNPSTFRGLLPTMSGWQSYGLTALGMVAPSLVTDRLLPSVGIVLTGWLRRGVQLLVPTSVHFFAPRLLGKDTNAFIAGGYAVTLLGVVNDFTGGAAGMVGGYVRNPGAVAGYVPFPRRTVAPAAVA